jgi:hypothetical protein
MFRLFVPALVGIPHSRHAATARRGGPTAARRDARRAAATEWQRIVRRDGSAPSLLDPRRQLRLAERLDAAGLSIDWRAL